jgi:hypothetical protein
MATGPDGSRSVGRDAAGIGLTSVVGAALNAAKLVLLAVLCSAHELDLMTAGLLVAVTGAQLAGEPLANFAVVRDRALTRRRPGAALPVVFLVAALFPDGVLKVVAPGLDATASEVNAVRLFCLAGAAMVLLWWAAGEAQRNLDFRGMKAVNLAPNGATVVALLVPFGARTTVVPIGLLIGCAVAAAVVAAGARRRAAPAGDPDKPRAAAARGWALASLFVLALATQANLIVLRVVASFLPEGSVSVFYIATGIVIVPAMAVGGSLTASLLPRWAAGSASGRLAHPGVAAATSGALTAALCAPLVAGFFLVRPVGAVKDAVDPAVLAGLGTALPIIAAGSALHGAVWVSRGYAIANGAIGTISVIGATGPLVILVAYALSPTLAGLSVGYALSVLPWLAAVPLVRARRRDASAPQLVAQPQPTQ